MAKLNKKMYEDDEYKIIHVDVEKIRTRPTQFVGSLGSAGIAHICHEIIDNARDEGTKKESPCDTIRVYITDKELRVVDNGRGIPTDIMQEVYETMQAGTNMTRANTSSIGENGLGGTTCTLALSSYLKVVSTRPTEKKRLTLEYHEGKLTDKILEEYTGTDHGLDVTFRPSRKVMGVGTIPCEELKAWLQEFDYTLQTGVKLSYSINGEQFFVRHKDLGGFISQTVPTDARMTGDLYFTCGGNLSEFVMEKEYKRHFEIEACLCYSDPDKYRGDDIRQSWMNMINTVQHGDHMNGVLKGFYKAITERIYKRNKKLEGTNLKKDVESHLNIVIKGSCNFAHMFSAQAKDRVMEEHLGKAIAEAVYNELSNSNNGVLNEMCDAIVGNYRARVEGEKMRNVASSAKAIKSWQKPDSYFPCSSVKTVEPKELFLVEGLSAGGGLKGARNAKYQAILTFRGKSLNVWDLTLDRALKSVPWLNLVKVLECGIGPTFDIKKLAFDKIIISTDADIDGFHIRVGISSFFAKFLPEIINAGKLYIAEPPLYKLMKDKEVFYVATQTEYLQKCIESVGDLEIEFPEMK